MFSLYCMPGVLYQVASTERVIRVRLIVAFFCAHKLHWYIAYAHAGSPLVRVVYTHDSINRGGYVRRQSMFEYIKI